MWKWIDHFINLLFPRYCLTCEGALSKEEKFICLNCLANFPRTNFHSCPDNVVEQRFWGQVPIVRGTSFLYYQKGSCYNKIVYHLKYNHCKEIGRYMGRNIAFEIKESGFFAGIDWIVPIPLHPKKEKQRGYNQSEWIARGVSEVVGIPVRTDLLIRKIHNPTQTRKTPFERWENVEGIFDVALNENLNERHLLLVDDVFTTGSTLLSASQSICSAYKVKITILTLAISGSY